MQRSLVCVAEHGGMFETMGLGDAPHAVGTYVLIEVAQPSWPMPRLIWGVDTKRLFAINPWAKSRVAKGSTMTCHTLSQAWH